MLPGLLFLLRQDAHHLVCVPALLQQISHRFHGFIDVLEEELVSGAQVIQARLRHPGCE